MEIVQLRPGRPLLSDIPAMMRSLADRIESGEVEAKSAMLIIPVDDDWPMVFGWGDHLGDYGNIAVCELTKAWFIRNKVSR